ncbi:hypothetical protein FEM03_01915 [Phragmitibacter flavus]|uniref:TPM domain-containing protein n=2 Tax=Phragmitibacter flavus TaxID=2576071 RepID=A0A5R8KKM5_9BACT|nr:hypothetical protein FEM03_01915 [Phragmitibacter flavus]
MLFVWAVTSSLATARVRDEAGIFTKDLGAQIQARTDECLEQSGVALHVVTFADLDDHLETRSVKLLKQLSGDEPAVMLAFGWGMDTPLIKISPSLGDRFAVGELTSLMADARRPFSDNAITLSQKFDAGSRVLNEGLIALEKKRQTLESRHFPMELFLSLAAVVLGTALLLWVALLWLQKGAARHEKFYFPDVDVEWRLGAPFGGGLMVQTSANKKPDRR